MDEPVTEVGRLPDSGRLLQAKEPLPVTYIADPEGGGRGFVAFYGKSTDEGYFGPYGWGETPEEARADLLAETLTAWQLYARAPSANLPLPEPALKRKRFLLAYFEER